MKKRFIIFASAIAIISSCQESKITEIKGNITNSNNTPLLITDDLNHVPDTLAIKDGEFNTSIASNNPGFKYVMFDRKWRELFLAPSYTLKLLFNGKNIEDSLTIEGEGAAENTILDSITKALNKIDKKFVYTTAVENGARYIDSSFSHAQRYLAEIASRTQLDPKFLEFEKISLQYYAAGYKIFIAFPKNIKDPSYFSFLKALDLENEKYMGIPNYRECINYYLNLKAQEITGGETDEKDQTEDKGLDAVLTVIEKIKNKNIREYFLFEKINFYIKADLVRDVKKYQTYFAAHNTDSLYAKKIQITYLKKLLLAPGQYAPEFTLYDIDSNEVSLKDFRGKYVYIDCWATWCPPCVEELPSYVKLQADYKNKDIAFISISFDEDKNKWKKFLKTKKKNSEIKNVHAEQGMNSAIAKSYQIKGLPVFILIDKEGRIIKHRAEMPSSIEIRNTLDRLLKIDETP